MTNQSYVIALWKLIDDMRLHAMRKYDIISKIKGWIVSSDRGLD